MNNLNFHNTWNSSPPSKCPFSSSNESSEEENTEIQKKEKRNEDDSLNLHPPKKFKSENFDHSLGIESGEGSLMCMQSPLNAQTDSLDELLGNHPAFFKVDPVDFELCLKGQLNCKKIDMLLWKFIYRLYALYTFSEEMPLDYSKLEDFISLEKIFKIAAAFNSKAYAAASSLIDELEKEKKLPHMTSLKFLSKGIRVSDELLLHVLADKYGQNSGFEGMSSLEGIEFAIKCFEMPEISSIIKSDFFESAEDKRQKIYSLLRTAHEFETLFEDFSKIEQEVKNSPQENDFQYEERLFVFWAQRKYLTEFVESFKQKLAKTLDEKKSVLIAGGWIGSLAGHCVYYKIDLQGDQRYTFTVFNRGDGVSRNGDIYNGHHEGKFRRPSSLSIKNIEKVDLFENIFIQGLTELKVFQCNHRHHYTIAHSTNYEAKDLYDALLPLLNGEVIVNEETPSLDLMSPQISGTCSWKSPCAFIRSELPFFENRLWITLAKEIAILNYFDLNSEQFSTDSSRRSLFEKCLESFSYTLKKITPDVSFFLGDDQTSKIHIDFFHDALELAESKVLESEKAKKVAQFGMHKFPLYQDNIRIFSKVNEYEDEEDSDYPSKKILDSCFNFNDNIAIKGVQSKHNGFSIDLFAAIRTKKWSAATLNNDLSLLTDQLEVLLKQKENLQVFHGFIEIMLHLPRVEDVFWHSLSLSIESTKKLMITLSSLQQLFYQSSDSFDTLGLAKTFTPVLALYKALAIQDCLITGKADQLDMQGLDCPPDYRELEFLLKNPDRQLKLEHYAVPFQSSSMRDAKSSDELEHIYDYFVSRSNSGNKRSLLFSRSETCEIRRMNECDDYYDEENKNQLLFSSSYTSKEIEKNAFNPELQYIIKFINCLTGEQLNEIEELRESREAKFFNKKYVQGEQFRDFDLELKVCLILTHDSIAEKILPPHFLSYRKQVERTWFWMHNIANIKGKSNKRLKIVEDEENSLTFSYKLINVISSTTDKIAKKSGIALYLSILERYNEELNHQELNFFQFIFPNFNIKTKERKELNYILYAPKNSRIDNALSYFTKHPEKLDDSNYRIFLNLVLFERNFLIKEFQNNPFFSKIISKFLLKVHERSIHLNNILAGCDLLVLCCQIFSYCLYANPSQISDLRNPQICINELKLLLKTATDPDERINVARSLIVCIGHKSTLDASDLQDLLYCHKISSISCIPIEGIDPLIFEEVQQVIWKFLPQIDAMIMMDPARFLTPLIKDSCYQAVWNRVSLGIYETIDQTCYCNIIKGFYQIKGSITLTLPPNFLNDRDYKAVFLKSYPATGFVNHEGSIVYQITKDAQEYSLSMVNNNLKIQKEEKGHLKTYYGDCLKKSLPHHFKLGDFIPFYRLESWKIWAYQIGSSYIFEINDEKDRLLFVTHVAFNETIDFKITVKKAGTEGLQLLDFNGDNQGYQTLYTFCQPGKVMLWGYDVPKQIEIPDHQLSFTAKSQGFGSVLFESHEHPGFYLDKNQYIEPLAKFSFNAYIVLRNDLGQKKILVNVRNGLLDKTWSQRKNHKKYYILKYDHQVRDGQRRLTASGRVEKLVLAAIAFSSKLPSGFLLARQLLQNYSFKIEDISFEELEILESMKSIVYKGDPREISIKLMVYDLVDATFNSHSDLKELLEKYTHIYHLIPGFTLSADAFVRLYEKVTKACKITFHEADMIMLLNEYYPKLKSSSLVNFAQSLDINNFYEFNHKAENSPCEISKSYHWSLEFRFEDVDFALLTRRPKNYFFWECLEILWNSVHELRLNSSPSKSLSLEGSSNEILPSKDISLDEPNSIADVSQNIRFLRKKITLLNGQKDMTHVVRTLDSLSSNLDSELVKIFLAECKKISTLGNIECSHFQTWDNFYKTIHLLVDTHPSKNPIQGIAIPKCNVKPSTDWLPLRPLRHIHHAANISTGQQFLQKRRSFAIHNTPAMSLTPPQFEEYFWIEGMLTSPIEVIKNEKIAQAALQVLKVKTKDDSSLIEFDPLTKKVLKDLESGIKQCAKEKNSKDFGFDQQNLPSLIIELTGYIKEKKDELDILELYLSNFARNQSFSLEKKMISAEKKSGYQVNLSLLDLIFLYAKEDISSLHDVEDQNELKEKITEFLTKATEIQKWNRCLEKALRLKEEPLDSALIIQELANEFSGERVFDPSRYPTLLVLEYGGNLLIRKEQFEKFEMLSESTNCILQMIPGSGKTSVIMKLIALLNADGKKLSLMILPEELFDSMQDETIEGGLYFFNQQIVALKVTREGCNTLDRLEKIRNEFRDIIKNKGAVITSPSSIHTLYLLFIEALCLPNSTTINSRLNLLRDILNIFKNESRVLLDEIDIILKIKKFVNFSLGETLGLNLEDTKLISTIYEIILGSKEITDTLKFKFYSKIAGEGAKLFTKELYKPLKTQIANKVLWHLTEEYEELKNNSTEILEDIFHFLIQEDPERAKKGVERINRFKSQALKNCLGLAKEQISALLPSTLIFNCGEDYGFSNESETALVIPYEKGKPAEGSRFGHPHEAANYTMQTALFVGIPKSAIKGTLNQIKEEIIKEMLLGILPKETAGYHSFKELWKGDEEINPLSITPEELVKIEERINGSKEITLYFAKTYLLPLIQFDTKKLSSPVGILYFLFGEQIEGFSGTLGNRDTFPLGVKCYPEPIIDAKTIFLLVEHLLEGNQKIMIIDEETGTAVFNSLKDMRNKEPVCAVIDGGGYLNQESPDSLAEKCQKELSTQESPLVILCHDNKGDLFLQKNSGKENPSNVEVDLHKRLTIYRQPYTTGTDIAHPSNAVGVVTVSRNVQLCDIIQNVRRMRQLDGNQRIRFMLTKDVLELIAATLNIKINKVDTIAILKFALINQIHHLQEDATKSTLQQILTAVQSEILKVLLSKPLDQFLHHLRPVMEVVFTPKQSTNSWDMYGHVSEEKETSKILEEESTKIMSSFMQALEKNFQLKNLFDIKSIEEQMKALNKNSLLPVRSIINSSTQMNQQVRVQNKQQIQVQESPKVMVSIEPEIDWHHFSWKEHVYVNGTDELNFKLITQLPTLDKQPFSFYPFQIYSGLNIFSLKLMTSINFALPSPSSINQTEPFGQNQDIISHIMLIEDQQEVLIVFIDRYDVSIAKDLKPFPSNCCLYNLVTGPQRIGSNFVLDKIIKNDEAHLALLQARLLAGYWQFTQDEKAVLKKWIRLQNLDEAGNFFKDIIFKHYFEVELLCARIAELFFD